MVAKSAKKKNTAPSKRKSWHRGVLSYITVFSAYILDLFASGWIMASGEPDTSEIPMLVSILAILMALIVIGLALYIGVILLIDMLH
jgi:hypothetical protein